MLPHLQRHYSINYTQHPSVAVSRLLARRRLSSSSSTVAQQRRSSHVADYAKGLGALVSSKRIPEAVSLLEQQLEQQRRPHALSAGDLLEALCAEGRHETAWQLIRRLSASNNRLPLKVLHRLLKTAGQYGSVDDVLAVYGHQQQMYGFASMGVQTTLIHALLKAHARGSPGNLLAYEAWGRLRGSGRQLDAQALLAGMHACVCVGRLGEAEVLLEPLRERAGAVSRPVVSGHNLLMKAHAQAGNTDAARKLFAAMKARGVAPDAVTYNTLLAAFVAAGEVLRARAVLDKMAREGVAPDVWSYSTLLLGLGRAGQLGEAQQVLRDMAAAGLQPNEATYAALINAYAEAGDMPAAHAMMQQLLDQQQQQQQHLDLQQDVQQQHQQKPMQQMQQQHMQQHQTSELLTEQPQQQSAPAAGAAGDGDGVAGQLQSSRRVLRQLYNSLIKGHLRLSRAAAAAAAADGGSSRGGIPSWGSPGGLDSSLDDWGYPWRQQQQMQQRQQQQQQSSVQVARLVKEAAAVSAAAGATASYSAEDQPQSPAAEPIQPAASAAAAAAELVVVQYAETAAAATAATDFQALGYQAAAAAAAAAAGCHVSGYQAALCVLEDMAAAGVSPGVDTYTLFIRHMVQVGDPGGLQALLGSLAAAGLAPDQVLLTSLLQAAAQAGNHAAALELFDVLIAACAPAVSSSPGEDINSSCSSTPDSNGIVSAVLEQEQQHQAASLPLPNARAGSNGSGGPSTASARSRSAQSAGQPSSAREMVAGPAAAGRNRDKQQRQQQQHPNVLPLTAVAGPDAVAWNALAAVLVQADRLSDAAAAVERGVQAAAAAGRAAPPIEGFAALIRGYRNAGIKPRAVAALRRFLSLGGRPGRVMCNDVITLCLRDNDLRTARQVVRAMELTGCLSDADLAGYHAWFSRWEARNAAAGVAAAGAVGGSGAAAAAGGYSGVPPGSSSSSGVGGAAGGQAAAVERLKWWLGLPNSYYVDSNGGSSRGQPDGGRRQQ